MTKFGSRSKHFFELLQKIADETGLPLEKVAEVLRVYEENKKAKSSGAQPTDT
jgi:hypothetical protein